MTYAITARFTLPLVKRSSWLKSAGSSLEHDRVTKGGLYARAGIPEFWIVNLISLELEVYRKPQPDPAARFDWGYFERFCVTSGQSVSPLEMPSAAVAVRDLLPSL